MQQNREIWGVFGAQCQWGGDFCNLYHSYKWECPLWCTNIQEIETMLSNFLIFLPIFFCPPPLYQDISLDGLKQLSNGLTKPTSWLLTSPKMVSSTKWTIHSFTQQDTTHHLRYLIVTMRSGSLSKMAVIVSSVIISAPAVLNLIYFQVWVGSLNQAFVRGTIVQNTQ